MHLSFTSTDVEMETPEFYMTKQLFLKMGKKAMGHDMGHFLNRHVTFEPLRGDMGHGKFSDWGH